MDLKQFLVEFSKALREEAKRVGCGDSAEDGDAVYLVEQTLERIADRVDGIAKSSP